MGHMMDINEWFTQFPGAITICDQEGILLEMNAAAEEILAEEGGRDLIGSNILDCHPEPARGKLIQMMKDLKSNVYTTHENDTKRLVYQAPWTRGRQYAGFFEISIEIPRDFPGLTQDEK